MFETISKRVKMYRHCALLSLSMGALFLAASCGKPEAATPSEPVTAAPTRDFDAESVIAEILAGASDDPLLPSVIDPDLVATQPWKIAYISKEPRVDMPKSVNDVYWYSAWLGTQETAKELNVQVEDYSIPQGVCSLHEECVLPQINIINKIIEQDLADGIVIGPTDSFRLAAVIEKATESGIPIVAMDTPVDTESILSFVVLNSYESAKEMGKWVAEQLNGKGNVLILTGPKTDQNATDRHRGILSGLSGSDIVVLDTQVANWSETRAQEVTADWLEEFPDIDAIFSSNDAMALGAITAIKSANRDGILVTGYDGLPPAMDAIREGDLAATNHQNPLLQAEIATRMLVQNLEKQSTFPPVVFLPDSPLITSQNVSPKK